MRHGLATLLLGVSLALAYGFPGNSVTRAVRASTSTSTTWSFELPEDLAPIKRSTLRAQLSSAVNRHHTSWASAVDIHGLPGGDRPADGLLRPCARPNRDQIRPRDHEIDICITPQVDDTDGAIDLDVARVNHREFGQDLLIGGKELVLISQTSPPDLHNSSKSSQTRWFTTIVPNNNDPFGRCADELLYYIGLMALDSPMSKAIASQPSLSGTSTRPHLGVSAVDAALLAASACVHCIYLRPLSATFETACIVARPILRPPFVALLRAYRIVVVVAFDATFKIAPPIAVMTPFLYLQFALSILGNCTFVIAHTIRRAAAWSEGSLHSLYWEEVAKRFEPTVFLA